MPEETSVAPQYVALKDLKFGDLTLKKGDPVPQEKGRSYHQMLSLGQIAVKPEATAAALPDGVYAAVLLMGNIAIFVDHEGQPTEVKYHGTQEPDEAARVTLDLEPGQLAAQVEFPDDTEATLVTFGSLTWGHAAGLLMHRLGETETARAQLETQLGTATEAVRSAGALQSQVDWLELMLKAVQLPGEPLADTQIGVKELAVAGITTLDGLRLLASGEQAAQNLTRLEGIGKKTAERILAGLIAPEPPEEVVVPPEPAATPTEG